MAENFLREARPSNFFRIKSIELHGKIQVIYTILYSITEKKAAAKILKLIFNYDNCGFNIVNRYKIFFEKFFLADRQYLFLQYLYLNLYSITLKRYLTSFDVKRNIFYSFFGIVKEEPSLNFNFDFINENVSGNVKLLLLL